MKQPNTEETIKHTNDDQNTGNHKLADAPDAAGADRFGGSRAGSENVEKTSASGEPATKSAEKPGSPVSSLEQE